MSGYVLLLELRNLLILGGKICQALPNSRQFHYLITSTTYMAHNHILELYGESVNDKIPESTESGILVKLALQRHVTSNFTIWTTYFCT